MSRLASPAAFFISSILRENSSSKRVMSTPINRQLAAARWTCDRLDLLPWSYPLLQEYHPGFVHLRARLLQLASGQVGPSSHHVAAPRQALGTLSAFHDGQTLTGEFQRLLRLFLAQHCCG